MDERHEPARWSVGRELSSSALRAVGQQWGAIRPVPPALRHRGELVTS